MVRQMTSTASRTATYAAPSRRPSEKQLAFHAKLVMESAELSIEAFETDVDLQDIVRQRGMTEAEFRNGLRANATKMAEDMATKSAAECSRQIDALLENNRERKIARAQVRRAEAQEATAELEAGIYQAFGIVYKVQKAVHGSGNMYAKRLVIGEAGSKGTFEYAPGIIRQLTPAMRMNLEQAKEFGAIYGMCCNCGATLTDERSIEAGIGPVCANRF